MGHVGWVISLRPAMLLVDGQTESAARRIRGIYAFAFSIQPITPLSPDSRQQTPQPRTIVLPQVVPTSSRPEKNAPSRSKNERPTKTDHQPPRHIPSARQAANVLAGVLPHQAKSTGATILVEGERQTKAALLTRTNEVFPTKRTSKNDRS